MEEDVGRLLLNGMPFSEFIVLYGLSFAGAMLSWWWTNDQQIRYDKRVENRFGWLTFKRTARRLITTLILMAFMIIYWKDISPLLFAGDAPVELNGVSAFIFIGVGMDKTIDVLFGGSQEVVKRVIKKG
jgi:hypothetical protein